jgi:hypothetical protein
VLLFLNFQTFFDSFFFFFLCARRFSVQRARVANAAQLASSTLPPRITAFLVLPSFWLLVVRNFFPFYEWGAHFFFRPPGRCPSR